MALLDIRALRKQRGLSQATLARAIGLSQKRVSAMELRPGSVTAAQLERIVDSEAAAFNLESVLHRVFRRWRLSAYDAAKLGVGESGATEWFRAECAEKVSSFVAANAEILGFTVTPVTASETSAAC